MPAFTNDDLKTLGAFDQAQGSTNDQLRLLRSIANRVGLYDAADAILKLITDTATETLDAAVLPKVTRDDTMETIYAEIEAMVAESNDRVVVLDAAMSDRIEAALGDVDVETAIDFMRRIMVELRVMPTMTQKVTTMSDQMTKHLLEVL